MRPTGYLETSVRNYHRRLRENPEELSSHPFRGGWTVDVCMRVTARIVNSGISINFKRVGVNIALGIVSILYDAVCTVHHLTICI